MKLLDLFSGISGFALAAQWVWGDDLDIAAFCEIDPYCQRVLKKHWPDVPIHKDITTLDGLQWRDQIDLITGGFPCQDISQAGKGEGITGSRSGLWFEMWQVIRDVRPRFCLIENVPALTFRGLDQLLVSLAQIGYDAEWQIVSAADVGANHLRKRIWIVAYPSISGGTKEKALANTQGNPLGSGLCETRTAPERRGRSCDSSADVAHSERHAERSAHGEKGDSWRTNDKQDHGGSFRDDIGDCSQEISGFLRAGCESRSGGRGIWESYPKISAESNWAVEPNVGRVAHGVPSRVDRLKALGNAIVPQCAEIIMRQIKNAMSK